MESIIRKIFSKTNLESNKVCVVSLTKFYNFIKLCELKSFLIKKIKKMVMTKISSILWGLVKVDLGNGLYGNFFHKVRSTKNDKMLSLL